MLHFNTVPTTKPRYTVTDTGHLAELLDSAQRRWPDVADRKQLLLLLAEHGHDVLSAIEHDLAVEDRRARTDEALQTIASLVDRDLLLSDRAWS